LDDKIRHCEARQTQRLARIIGTDKRLFGGFRASRGTGFAIPALSLTARDGRVSRQMPCGAFSPPAKLFDRVLAMTGAKVQERAKKQKLARNFRFSAKFISAFNFFNIR